MRCRFCGGAAFWSNPANAGSWWRRSSHGVRAISIKCAPRSIASRARFPDPACAGTRDRDEPRARVRGGRTLPKDEPIGELIALDVAFHSLVHRWSGNDAIVEIVA